MRTNQTCLEYNQFDRDHARPAEPKATTSSILHKLKQGWRHLNHLWTGNNDPQIREMVCPSGTVFWVVEDQFNNESYQFDTEEQVLAWLENRHQRSSRLEGWGGNWIFNA